MPRSHCSKGHELTPANIWMHKGKYPRCKRCNSDNQRIFQATRTYEQKRDTFLRNYYGITLAEYNLILESQGFRCAICKDDNIKIGRKKEFYVDHDHATGRVRGILCHGCNSGIGMFKESLSIIESAAEYMKKGYA